MAGTNFSDNAIGQGGKVNHFLTNDKGEYTLVASTVTNIPSAVAGYAYGCILMATNNGALYSNTGGVTSCTFTIVSTVTAGSVTLAMLAAGITPSHIVVYAGTASGGTTATRAYTVTGALSTDVATAVIRASTTATTIQKAVLTTDTLTITFTADPGVSTTVDYSILRAAS